jgi:phosphomannomutase
MTPIKFGTDGWRAVIADDFTFANLGRVAQATVRWLKKRYGETPRVVLGHDTRFMGREFAEHVARIFGTQGISVRFADTFTTTPAISWATKHFGCNAGIVITASHNPPKYNGFKIKADFGGPAPPELIAEVEQELSSAEPPSVLPTFDDLVSDGPIELIDLNSAYLNLLREKLDIEGIARNLKIAHDAMFGAAQGLVSRLLGHDRVVELHCDFNPGFHGQSPEPIERNLQALAEVVVREKCDLGLANDGDADRIGLFDETGRFVTSHEILALLVKYLHKEQGLKGDVIKTFSTTHLLEKMGQAYGLRVETTPIGFKHIAKEMVQRDVLVGGEESGGIAVKGHIPERDGIYIGLLIAEMLVRRGQKLSALVQELYEEFGPHFTYRIDLHTTEDKKQSALRQLRERGGLQEVAGDAVREVQTLDGFKHITDRGWVLVRPSGTEPLLRVYAEAPSPQLAEAYVHSAVEQLGFAEVATH